MLIILCGNRWWKLLEDIFCTLVFKLCSFKYIDTIRHKSIDILRNRMSYWICWSWVIMAFFLHYVRTYPTKPLWVAFMKTRLRGTHFFKGNLLISWYAFKSLQLYVFCNRKACKSVVEKHWRSYNKIIFRKTYIYIKYCDLPECITLV